MNDDSSDDSDIDISDLIEHDQGKQEDKVKEDSRRQKAINNIVNEKKMMFGIQEMQKFVEGEPELESFKLNKFRLSITRELSKFFEVSFAANIELSLQIIHVLKKHNGGSPDLDPLLRTALETIWNGNQKIPRVAEILSTYYS